MTSGLQREKNDQTNDEDPPNQPTKKRKMNPKSYDDDDGTVGYKRQFFHLKVYSSVA